MRTQPRADARQQPRQLTAAARARGHAGNQRLHDRWLRFELRRKRTVIANVAVARELAGWCWSLATLTEDAPPARSTRAGGDEHPDHPAGGLRVR